MISNPTRALRIRYIIGLSVIASLTILAQFFVQRQIISQEADANVVNIAGRQRMLSQRLSKEALLLLADDTEANREQLEATLLLWQTSHIGLQAGNELLNLPGENSETITGIFAEIEPNYTAMVTAADCLIEAEIPGCPEDDATQVETILANEGDFLLGMNDIVFQYADEAEGDLTRLRVVEVALAATTLLVLVLEVFFIFHPAEVQIQQTLSQLQDAQRDLLTINDELENRVKARTRQLSHANSQLQQANEDMLTFTRMFSHDLKSPVASIKGFVRELEMDWHTLEPHLHQLNGDSNDDIGYIVQDSIPDALDAMDTSAKQMDHLLKSIGQLSRDGQRQLKIEPIAVWEIVEDTVEQYRRQFQTKNIQLEIGTLPDIQADRTFIERTFDNLISNAIKYSDPDRPNTIRIYGEDKGDSVTYFVKDTGLGIEEADRDLVFQMFKRGRNINDDVEGDGIGMYVIRNIVQRHGGTIDFDSTPGQGSTFYFNLPKQISESANVTE